MLLQFKSGRKCPVCRASSCREDLAGSQSEDEQQGAEDPSESEDEREEDNNEWFMMAISFAFSQKCGRYQGKDRRMAGRPAARELRWFVVLETVNQIRRQLNESIEPMTRDTFMARLSRLEHSFEEVTRPEGSNTLLLPYGNILHLPEPEMSSGPVSRWKIELLMGAARGIETAASSGGS